MGTGIGMGTGTVTASIAGSLLGRQPSHHQLPHRPRGFPGSARTGTAEADRHGLSNDALREFLAYLFLAKRGFFGRFAERFCSGEVWLSRTAVSELFVVYSAELALRTGTRALLRRASRTGRGFV